MRRRFPALLALFLSATAPAAGPAAQQAPETGASGIYTEGTAGLLLYGYEQENQGNWRQAADAYLAAITRPAFQAQDPEIYERYVKSAWFAGDYDKAIAIAKKARGEEMAADFCSFALLMDAVRRDAPGDVLRALPQANPGSDLARDLAMQISVVYTQAGRNPKAALQSFNTPAYFTGMILHLSGKDDEALPFLKQAARDLITPGAVTRPPDLTSQEMIVFGDMLRKAGAPDAAQEIYRHAAMLGGESPEILQQAHQRFAGGANVPSGEFTRAQLIAQHLHYVVPQYRRPDMRDVFLGTADFLYPRHDKIRIARSSNFAASGHAREGLAALDAGGFMPESAFDLQNARASALFTLGRVDEAQAALGLVKPLEPASIMLRSAFLDFQAGRLDQAIATVSEITGPNAPELHHPNILASALNLQASALLQSDRQAEAVPVMRRIVEISRQPDPGILAELGYALTKAGDLAGAKGVLDEANRLTSGGAPNVLAALGFLAYAGKDYPKARALFEDSLDFSYNQPNALLLEHYADTLAAMGFTHTARLYWTAALKDYTTKTEGASITPALAAAADRVRVKIGPDQVTLSHPGGKTAPRL